MPFIICFVPDFNWYQQKIVLRAFLDDLTLHLQANVTLYSWHSFCLAVDFQQETYDFVTRNFNSTGPIETAPDRTGGGFLPGGGVLILGQEQDSPEGMFSVEQSVSGSVADFAMYSRLLPRDAMVAFVLCIDSRSAQGGVVGTFDDFENNWEAVGDTELFSLPKSVFCRPESRDFILLPERRTYEGSLQLCTKLGLAMALPENILENTKLHEKAVSLESECVSAHGVNLWLGAQVDLGRKRWLSRKTGEEVSSIFGDRRYSRISESTQCLGQSASSTSGVWKSITCFRSKACTACEKASGRKFRMKGLCNDSLFDREFYMHGAENTKPVFHGVFYSKVFWSNATWVMTSRLYPRLRATMNTRLDDYPLGRHTWDVSGDLCPDGSTDILLTACDKDKFTCDDGACYEKAQRCDQRNDCSDKSDEEGCRLIVYPDDYSKTRLPPPKGQDKRANISLNINVTNIRNMDVLQQEIAFDICVLIRWEDLRLSYHNLRGDTYRNLVKDMTPLWLPRLVITDDTESRVDVEERSRSLIVIPGSFPLEEDDSLVTEGEDRGGDEG